MIRKTLIGLLASLCVGASAYDLINPIQPELLYNPSPSAPIGWYRLKKDSTISRDIFVAAYPPQAARRLAHKRGYLPFEYPLIKQVWAGPQDKVCRSKTGYVSAPDRPDILALRQDSLGRDLPAWTGCIILNNDQYFLASPGHIYGWDSRYFGPVSKDDILGPAQFLGKSPLGMDQTG